MIKITVHCAIFAAAILAAVAGCGGASSTSKPMPVATPASTPSPTTPALSAAQQQFVSDMRSQFGFNGNTDTEVAGYGQAVCTERAEGNGQRTVVANMASLITGSTSDHEAVVRLAEKDLCPTYLPPPPQPSPPPPTMVSQTDTVVFSVQGTGLPSIQYGTDSSNFNPGNLGPLGNGNALPWQASVPYNPSSLYYAVTAQLQGSGSITDSVTEVIITKCSGLPPKTESFPLAHGQASGGYAIAQAEYAGGDTGNAQQAESDAGC